MLQITKLLIIVFMGYANTAHAYSPEAYPGWIWNGASYDFQRIEGFLDQGTVTQGIQWFTLPGEIPFNTYASYRWRLRSLNNKYFNANGPAVGAEFSKDIFRWGVQYEWQSFPTLSESINNPSVYFNWFKSVDFISGDSPSIFGLPILGTPTTTWGRITHDFGYFEGIGSMGYLSQGIDWVKLPADIVLRTQVLYYWRFRALNKEYFNVHGPAAGVEFIKGSVNGGAMYAWDHFTTLNQDVYNFRIYLNVYFDWDLKKIGGASAATTGV